MAQQPQSSELSVLLVEDSDDFAALVEVLLDGSEFTVRRAGTLREAEHLASGEAFACALVDLDLPDASGLDAVMALRTACPALALVVLTGQASTAAPIKAMLIGAQDWVNKDDVASGRLSQALRLAIARQEANAETSWLAFHDQLTCLPNRALAAEHLARAMARASRGSSRVAVLFCDLDGFKDINDRLGHAAGDQVLSLVARRLVAVIRPGDVAARWGGDEFIVIAEVDRPEHALIMAHRIRHAMTTLSAESAACDVTLSIGISVSAPQQLSPAGLLEQADQALLTAKRAGAGVMSSR